MTTAKTLAELEAAQAAERESFIRRQSLLSQLPATPDIPTICQHNGYASLRYTRPTLRAALELVQAFGEPVPAYEYAATFGHWEPIELRDIRKHQNEFENATRDPRPFAAELRLNSFAIYSAGGLDRYQSSAELSAFVRVGERLCELGLYIGEFARPPHQYMMRPVGNHKASRRWDAPPMIKSACKRETRYHSGTDDGVDARFYFSELSELAALVESMEGA